MAESLLGVLLVTLSFILILVVLLPELVRWLAHRNVQQRRLLIQAVRQLEADLVQLAEQLDPFRSLQAPQYRRIYAETTALLEKVQTSRQAIAAPGELSFPHLQPVRWAIQHFIVQPQDVWQVFYTYRRLRVLQRQVRTGQERMTDAYRDLDRLHQMPLQFQNDIAAIRQQLEQVQALLQQERTAGVTALAEMEQEYGRLRQQAGRLQRQLADTETITLSQADRLGQELDEVEAGLANVKQEAQELQQERKAFDENWRQAAVALEKAEARVDAERVPTALQCLLQTMAMLDEETAELRRTTDFTQGKALLADMVQLTALTNDYLTTDALIQPLVQALADSLEAEPIAGLHRQWQQSEDELTAQLTQPDLRTALSPLPRSVIAYCQQLQTRLRQMQRDAETLQQQEQETARRLEREAHQSVRSLNQAWHAFQRTLTLADGDALAKKYHSLMRQREAAKGQPRSLQKLQAAAHELTDDLRASQAYLQLRFDNLGALAREYPKFVSEVEKDAGGYRCLAAQLNQVKESAAGIQQLWQHAPRTGWLAETHKLLDEVKLLNQQAQQVYAGLDQQLTQFEGLVANIEQTVSYVQSIAGDLEDSRVERVLGMIDVQYEQAAQAATCEQALAALQRAEKYANELVTR